MFTTLWHTISYYLAHIGRNGQCSLCVWMSEWTFEFSSSFVCRNLTNSTISGKRKVCHNLTVSLGVWYLSKGYLISVWCYRLQSQSLNGRECDRQYCWTTWSFPEYYVFHMQRYGDPHMSNYSTHSCSTCTDSPSWRLLSTVIFYDFSNSTTIHSFIPVSTLRMRLKLQ